MPITELTDLDTLLDEMDERIAESELHTDEAGSSIVACSLLVFC